jgi:dihydroorotase
MNELLQQVRIIDPVSATDRLADVLIVEGKIAAIAPQITDFPTEIPIRNCQGLVLGTGLVDLYSHSGEPGFEERETLRSLMLSAAAGGFTRLAILPDTSPPSDRPGAIAWLKEQVSQLHHHLPTHQKSSFHFWGALTLGGKGEQMAELADLVAAGVAGFSDGSPINNLGLLRRLLEYLQPLGKPIAIWPCDRHLVLNGAMREGTASIRFGLPGNPAISETAALAALLEIVADTQTPVHIMRLSTARSVELIQIAKERGLPITASTTWMHVLLDAEAIGSYNPSLHLNPPLGNPRDRIALTQGLKSGVIDAIAIDHAPYTYEEKTVAFAEAPPGAIGLELALPLLWQTLVATGEFSALELWRVLSSRPAECLQQIPAAIAPQQPAELTLFDPNLTWQVNRKNLNSLAANSPWFGEEITGKVIQAWSTNC